jgi:hypothetical protein
MPYARRADAGIARLDERDVAGLLLCGDMYGAPTSCWPRSWPSDRTGCGNRGPLAPRKVCGDGEVTGGAGVVLADPLRADRHARGSVPGLVAAWAPREQFVAKAQAMALTEPVAAAGEIHAGSDW